GDQRMTWVRRGGERLLDRRVTPRAEYRRTAPGLFELDGLRCAVRDLGLGGLRIEPAPAGRVWEAGQHVVGVLQLRTGGRMTVSGRIRRIDRAGLAVFPEGGWPGPEVIDAERAALIRNHQERRAAPRLPLPPPTSGGIGQRTPLLDVSTTGLRYVLGPAEPVPAAGSRVEGELRLDADAVIPVRGRVVRHGGGEVAVAFDPPGLTPEVLAMLRRRFFPTIP
ncbi:MAG TPA: PilZ domain-containing protein, partial [Actinoplanes sp.]|nr:PilZ domain-containing protein [Actinoplanes sp.]